MSEQILASFPEPNKRLATEVVEITSKLAYFDIKTPIPVSIFQNLGYSGNSLKKLNELKLITLKNDSDYFMLNRDVHAFDIDHLTSIVTYLNEDLKRYKYRDQDVLLIIHHAVSAWMNVLNCTQECYHLIDQFKQFSINIAYILIYELELEISIGFTKRCYKKYSRIYGKFDELTLRMTILYGISYGLIEDYDRSLQILNRISNEEFLTLSDNADMHLMYGIVIALQHKYPTIIMKIEVLENVKRIITETLGENNIITSRITLHQIKQLLEYHKYDLAFSLITHQLDIIRDENLDHHSFIFLEFLLHKAVIYSEPKNIKKAIVTFQTVRNNIKHWHRYSTVLANYVINAERILFEGNPYPETVRLIRHTMNLGKNYFAKNSYSMQKLENVLSLITNKIKPKTKRSNTDDSHRLEENLDPNITSTITDTFIGIQTFHENCIGKAQYLIKDFTRAPDTTTVSSKPMSYYEIASNSILLLTVLLRKITGNKYTKNVDPEEPSDTDLNVAAINICHDLESIIRDGLIQSTNDLDFSAIQSVLRKGLKNCSNALKVSKMIQLFIRSNFIGKNNEDLNTVSNLINEFLINYCLV